MARPRKRDGSGKGQKGAGPISRRRSKAPGSKHMRHELIARDRRLPEPASPLGVRARVSTPQGASAVPLRLRRCRGR